MIVINIRGEFNEFSLLSLLEYYSRVFVGVLSTGNAILWQHFRFSSESLHIIAYIPRIFITLERIIDIDRSGVLLPSVPHHFRRSQPHPLQSQL